VIAITVAETTRPLGPCSERYFPVSSACSGSAMLAAAAAAAASGLPTWATPGPVASGSVLDVPLDMAID
jgi:hypothetical protein